MIGLREPAAKGATVKGIIATASDLRLSVSVKMIIGPRTSLLTSQRSNDSCHESDLARAQVLGHLLSILSFERLTGQKNGLYRFLR